MSRYCQTINDVDETVSPLAHENIWKEALPEKEENNIKHDMSAKITKHELDELLLDYASAAYWYGEDTGKYGAPDPDAHVEIFDKIRKAIKGVDNYEKN